jgi:hypothetical protein
MSFEVATKIGLGYATIPNITQSLISTAQSAGLWRTFKGALKLASPTESGKILRTQVRQSGSTVYSVLQQVFGYEHPSLLRNVANIITTASGFKAINKYNNMLAAAVARDFIPELHTIANRAKEGIRIPGTKISRRQWARNKLKKEFNVDWKKPITEDKLLETMVKFARESQLQKNVLKDPEMFNMPKSRPFFVFKRFGYRQYVFMKDLLKQEVSSGNVLVPLRLAAAGWAGGSVVLMARDQIRSLLSGEPRYTDDEKAVDTILEHIAAVGALGVMSDIMAAESIAQSVRFAVVPVVLSDVDRLWDSVTAFYRDLDNNYGMKNSLQRSIIRVSPIFGGVSKDIAKQIQPGSQKDNRIKQMRGEKRMEIIDLIIDKDKDLARRKLVKWNDNWAQEGYPITIDMVGMKEVYIRYLEMKKRAM